MTEAMATAMIAREEALAQLAEVVDERHDRLVAGRGGGRCRRCRDRVRREAR